MNTSSMNLQQIKQEIIEERIGAITLDTSIFMRYQFNFESGWLFQLEQFFDSSTKLIISEVVKEEIYLKLIERTKQSQESIKKELQQSQLNWCISDSVIEQIHELVFNKSQPKNIVEQRFNEFVELTDLYIVKAQGNVNVDALLQKYFNAEPPFEKTGKKKCEFPDAIALMSLEKWAKDNQTRVIVVADDKDWMNFCNNSEELIYTHDLKTVLGFFQVPDAYDICKYLSEQYKSNKFIDLKLTNLYDDLVKMLDLYLNRLSIDYDVVSSFIYEEDFMEIVVKEIEFKAFEDEGPQLIFSPLNFEDNSLVVEANINVTVEVYADFSLFVYDSVDQEDVYIGSNHQHTQTNCDANILISFTGHFYTQDEKVKIDNIKVNDLEIDSCSSPFIFLDFGELEPDY